jgi:hypothetical protein
MSAKPPPAELLALFDSNPGKYKDTPEPDGYNPTQKLVVRLHRPPQIPNPNAQQNVPKPINADDLWSVLTEGEMASIGMEGLRLLQDALESGDRSRIKRLVGVALEKAWIGQSKHDAIVAEINAEIPDPDWTATVAGPNDREATWPQFASGVRAKYIDSVLGRS